MLENNNILLGSKAARLIILLRFKKTKRVVKEILSRC